MLFYAMITEDGRCDVEIKTRIGMAKDAFNKRSELLTQRLDRKLKKIYIKALCGVERYMVRKREQLGKRKSIDCKHLKCGYREEWRR